MHFVSIRIWSLECCNAASESPAFSGLQATVRILMGLAMPTGLIPELKLNRSGKTDISVAFCYRYPSDDDLHHLIASKESKRHASPS
jgi:hypothetical protein